jgi:hypothetical protein
MSWRRKAGGNLRAVSEFSDQGPGRVGARLGKQDKLAASTAVVIEPGLGFLAVLDRCRCVGM